MKLVDEMAVLKESCGQRQQQHVEYRKQHNGMSSSFDDNYGDEGEVEEDGDGDGDDDELEEMGELTTATTAEIGRDLAPFGLTERVSKAERGISMLFEGTGSCARRTTR